MDFFEQFLELAKAMRQFRTDFRLLIEVLQEAVDELKKHDPAAAKEYTRRINEILNREEQ